MGAREQFECPVCHDLHSRAIDAEGCCPREEVRRVWICTECETEHETEPAAVECCADEEDEADPTRPTASPAELEMAGQMRIPFEEESHA